MAFIQKGTTILLVFLLGLSVVVVLFSMAFYRNTLGKVNSEIEERDNEIERLSGMLEETNVNLTGAMEKLDLQIKRESNLSSLFTDLKTIKEKTDDEKKTAEGKLNQTQGELLGAKLQMDNLQYKYDNLNSNYLAINTSYATILTDVDKICTKASSLNISQCKKYN